MSAGKKVQKQKVQEEERTMECRYNFATRSKAGVSFGEFHAVVSTAKTAVEDVRATEAVERRIECTTAPEHSTYSADGRLFAAATATGVVVRTTGPADAPDALSLLLPPTHVVRLAFSPLGTYLVTWERQTVRGAPNLFVWALRAPTSTSSSEGTSESTGEGTTPPPEPVAAFTRRVDGDQAGCWPLLAWSPDERYCVRVCAECLEITAGAVATDASPLMRIAARSVGLVEWCPVPEQRRPGSAGSAGTARGAGGALEYLLAVFCVPRGTAQAGSVAIYAIDPVRYPACAKARVLPVSERTFFAGDTCAIRWNPAAGRGQPAALLALVGAESDPSGKTYYGESSLFILFAARPELNGPVPLKKPGNVHDIAWSPCGRLFAIVYGYMPAMTSVFEMLPNGRCLPRAELGPLARNTVRFSPDSRVLFVGGFGNLAGDMDFFDTASFAVLGRANAHTSTQWEWSPDGAFLACGVTAPRRHIDNGFHVFAVNGQLVYSQLVPELYDFAWQPAPALTAAAVARAPPRPRPPADPEARLTISRGPAEALPGTAAAGSAGGAAPKAQATVPTGKYVPPHLRRAAGAATAATPKPAPAAPKSDTMQVYTRDGTLAKPQQPQKNPSSPAGTAGKNKNKNKKKQDQSNQLSRRVY